VIAKATYLLLGFAMTFATLGPAPGPARNADADSGSVRRLVLLMTI